MTNSRSTLLAKKKDDILRLKPKVDLVASTVEEQREAMTKALEGADEAVVLDLSACGQIDSLGITLVLGLFKGCQKANLRFSVEGVSSDLMRVFRLFNLTKFFTVVEA